MEKNDNTRNPVSVDVGEFNQRRTDFTLQSDNTKPIDANKMTDNSGKKDRKDD